MQRRIETASPFVQFEFDLSFLVLEFFSWIIRRVSVGFDAEVQGRVRAQIH